MEPLEKPGASSYGYTPYPCEFRHVLEELEKMAGTNVNVIIEDGMGGPEIVRMNGRLGLAERNSIYPFIWIGYSVGNGESDGFQICEEKFTRAQLVPGMVWLEVGPHILIVERRHFPPDLDEVGGQEGDPPSDQSPNQ